MIHHIHTSITCPTMMHMLNFNTAAFLLSTYWIKLFSLCTTPSKIIFILIFTTRDFEEMRFKEAWIRCHGGDVGPDRHTLQMCNNHQQYIMLHRAPIIIFPIKSPSHPRSNNRCDYIPRYPNQRTNIPAKFSKTTTLCVLYTNLNQVR